MMPLGTVRYTPGSRSGAQVLTANGWQRAASLAGLRWLLSMTPLGREWGC